MASKQRIQVANLSSFVGGLNLRADAFELAENESPDLINVDVDPRGGFKLRRGVQPFAQTQGSPAVSSWLFERAGASEVMMAQADGGVYRSNGGDWIGTVNLGASTSRTRATTFKDNCYLQRASEIAAQRWSGTVMTALATTFNDDLTNPTGGNMPQAHCIVVHQGSVWVANTVESGVAHKNRVRWSHPNFPEDWRSYDFIDIDTGVDGDEITALVPFGDRLLVFKRKSVHAIYGFGPDGFQVLPVSQSVGATSQEAVVNTDVGVWFFSWPQGVFLYDGKNIAWQFERIYPAIREGSIPDAYQDKIIVGWGNRRLWVSVPWQSSTDNARTFLLDPTLGKSGAWVVYDVAINTFVEWKPPGADKQLVASAVGKLHFVTLDRDQSFDDFGVTAAWEQLDGEYWNVNAEVTWGSLGTRQRRIPSYYRTRWIDFGQPAIVKRWKRPEFVLLGGGDSQVYVQAFVDYDSSQPKKSFYVSTKADGIDVLTWDDDAAHGWDVGAVWARTSADRNDIAKGEPLANARAVSLLFFGPHDTAKWGVDTIIAKFVPRPVRA